MRIIIMHTTPIVLFALLAFKELQLGHAKRTSIRGRGLKGSSLQRTTPLENDIEDERMLEDYPPCTYFYAKKSKFNKYDDDWYEPCKTEQRERYPTASPRTRPPSLFFGTTPSAGQPPTNANVWNNPELEIIASETAPSPIVSSQVPAPKPTLTPGQGTSTAPVPSEPVTQDTVIEVNPGGDVTAREEEPSCPAAQAGSVFPTSVNFTFYYQYELLADRKSNMTNVVWPAMDRAFQRFLALELIDCEINLEIDGASPTFASRLNSVSPEPIDSIGSVYPQGWNNDTSVNSEAASCTNIVIDEGLLADKDLYCDVVTGSVTVYLSEVFYMDASNSPAVLFLNYRNKVIQTLRDEINAGGGAISNFLDKDLGVRGFYFISEPTDVILGPTGISGSGSKSKTPSATTIATSLAALTVLAMATVGFAIHHKKRHLDDEEETFKNTTTPRTEGEEMDFFGSDDSYGFDTRDDESDDDEELCKRQTSASSKMFSHNMSDSQPSEDEIPNSEFATIYGIDEKDSQLYTSFDYSQLGVSVHLKSPEKSASYNLTEENLSINANGTISQSSRPDPSVVTNRLDPESDGQEYPDDESSCAEQRLSEDSYSTQNILSDLKASENEMKSSVTPSSSTTPLSRTGSPALDYILSLGTSILSTPKPIEESNMTDINRDVESTKATVSPLKESQARPVTKTPSFSAVKTRKSITPISAITPDTKSERDVSSMNYKSPTTAFKTPSPKSSSGIDTDSSQKSTGNIAVNESSKVTSPPTGSSNLSRTEYLKNRRRALESRFQNYRRSLSESINGLNEPPAGSWSVSREFSRSVSLHKNSSQPMLSPKSVASINSILTGGTPSSIRVSQILCGIAPSPEDNPGHDTTIDHSPERRRSRTMKTPRIRKNYASLNDIEEILEREEAQISTPAEGMIELQLTNDPPSPEIYNEKQKIGDFLGSRSSTPRIDPIQFQPDTVIL